MLYLIMVTEAVTAWLPVCLIKLGSMAGGKRVYFLGFPDDMFRPYPLFPLISPYVNSG